MTARLRELVEGARKLTYCRFRLDGTGVESRHVDAAEIYCILPSVVHLEPRRNTVRLDVEDGWYNITPAEVS